MQFDFPAVITTKPSVEKWLDIYGTNWMADIAYKAEMRAWLRTCVAEAQNWKCCYCGCETEPTTKNKNSATLEHVLPKSLGGTDDWDNLAMACMKCNTKRGNTDAEAFLVKIAAQKAGV